jgi:hypothetical protein
MIVIEYCGYCGFGAVALQLKRKIRDLFTNE